MASAKNWIIAGDYEKKAITTNMMSGKAILVSGLKKIPIDSTTVASYELLTDEQRKSAASGAARGLVGWALLGPIGAIAGASSAKNKGIYQVAIEFKDGKRSLAEVDDKIYKAIVKNCF